MEDISAIQAYWSFILFLFGTAIGIGILSDKMWGWVWSDKLSIFFDKLANRTFDLHFSSIIHDDYTKSLKKLNMLFGTKFFSMRMIKLKKRGQRKGVKSAFDPY